MSESDSKSSETPFVLAGGFSWNFGSQLGIVRFWVVLSILWFQNKTTKSSRFLNFMKPICQFKPKQMQQMLTKAKRFWQDLEIPGRRLPHQIAWRWYPLEAPWPHCVGMPGFSVSFVLFCKNFYFWQNRLQCNRNFDRMRPFLTTTIICRTAEPFLFFGGK